MVLTKLDKDSGFYRVSNLESESDQRFESKPESESCLERIKYFIESMIPFLT